MEKQEAADVYCNRKLAGRIYRTKHGSTFQYEKTFLRETTTPLAINLPLTELPIVTQGVNLHTFFAGLLPEGLRLQTLVRISKTSPDDLLTLLINIGADCIGDVSVVKKGQPLPEIPKGRVRGNLSEVSFRELFDESLHTMGKQPDTAIAGAQPKVSDAMISFPLNLKTKSGTNFFILKIEHKDFPRIIENEYFFMRMADACGVNPAKVHIVYDRENRPGLLVERFDREVDANGKVMQVHQEDACQLLDRYPADKYNLSLREIGEGLSVCSMPILEVARVLGLYAFSYLIGNGDLHGKNISVQRLSRGNRVTLSPSYDLLTTLPYSDQHMAIKIEGRDAQIKRRHIIELGERLGVRKRATEAMLDDLLKRAAPYIDRVSDIGFGEKKSLFLSNTMRRRASDLSDS